MKERLAECICEPFVLVFGKVFDGGVSVKDGL